VEFALVIPIFLVVVVAIAEFAFFLTIKTGVTDAAQDAAQLASELGNTSYADNMILQLVEKDMGAPADKSKIASVEIISTDLYGKTNNGEDFWQRTGSTTVTINNVAVTVPYTETTKTYLEASRCNVISVAVCGGVDWIAVKIIYNYSWVTPLPSLIGLGATAPQFVQTSVSRLEPIQ
jgi:Flp pilus assembly protein TadG